MATWSDAMIGECVQVFSAGTTPLAINSGRGRNFRVVQGSPKLSGELRSSPQILKGVLVPGLTYRVTCALRHWGRCRPWES